MTDIKFGGKARVTWRFRKNDGTEGSVDGDPVVNATSGTVVEQAHLVDQTAPDGTTFKAWTALVANGKGMTTISVDADVDMEGGDDHKAVKNFVLATDVNFLADGQTETVSDVTVTAE